MLILDIFAQHATSRDGKLQVELAQLKYALPRLIEKNTMMSRLTGGIGGRGPGETKLEINRRRARDRINLLEKQLEELAGERRLRRQRATEREVPIVAICGYTNAGKSTLLNALTEGDALAEDKLFATLDPISRRLRFPQEREVVITDTVGFIRDLPEELFAAFRATLEEMADADLLLHVVDASDPDRDQQIRAVEGILADLGLGEKPRDPGVEQGRPSSSRRRRAPRAPRRRLRGVRARSRDVRPAAARDRARAVAAGQGSVRRAHGARVERAPQLEETPAPLSESYPSRLRDLQGAAILLRETPLVLSFAELAPGTTGALSPGNRRHYQCVESSRCPSWQSA